MKRFLTIILSILLCVGVFVGCSSEEEQSLLSQVEQLSAQIEGLQTEIERLQTQVEEVQNQLNQTKNELLTVNGEFISLEEAYESGFLTREDLVQMANYVNSHTYADKAELPSITEQAIQGAFASEHNISQSDVSVRYYGWYGRCIAVNCRDIGWLAPGVEVEKEIDGVIFVYTMGGEEIEIWKY